MVFLLLLAACQSVEALPPTATTVRVIQATMVPTVDRALHAVASAAPGTLPTPDECQETAALPTTRHTVRAEISYEQHTVAVEQTIRTINRGSEALNEIVLDVEPNRFPEIFTLDSLMTDHGAIILSMGKSLRRPEPGMHEEAYRRMGIPILGRIEQPGMVEGGDCVWVDARTLAIGRGVQAVLDGPVQRRCGRRAGRPCAQLRAVRPTNGDWIRRPCPRDQAVRCRHRW